MKAMAWITNVPRGESPSDKIVSVSFGPGIVPLVMSYEQALSFMSEADLSTLDVQPLPVKVTIERV